MVYAILSRNARILFITMRFVFASNARFCELGIMSVAAPSLKSDVIKSILDRKIPLPI